MTAGHEHPARARAYAKIMMRIALTGMAFMALAVLYTSRRTAAELSAIPVETDFAAPDLELRTLAGEPASLEDFRGSVVLINLWATWCPPCRAEMPALQKFYEQHGDDGFVLVGINQEETRETVLPFTDQFKLTFTIWLDEDSLAQRAFNTVSLPSSYVIDRAGRVRLIWIGGISRQNLQKYVLPMVLEQ